MYITNRLATASILLAGLLPLATFAVVMTNERINAERAFRGAITDAQEEYQLKRNLPLYKKSLEAHKKETRSSLITAMREKRVFRLKIVAIKREIESLQKQYALEGIDRTALEDTIRSRSEEIAGLVRLTAVRQPDAVGGDVLLRRMLTASLGDITEEDLLQTKTRGAFTAFVTILAKSEEVNALMVQYEGILQDARKKSDDHARVLHALAATDAQLENIQKTVKEVHEQVIRMQGALARIDAQIRARIERELLEKGLLTPGSLDRSPIAAKPSFAWPAYGPISAGFMDPTYAEHFGIPHLGMDIVIAQGSPVYAAADGVVFFAHDGGTRGYSYVLVGHRGGYATLYGHISRLSVSSGQDVQQGSLIGLSGGAVGGYGSGPTTTGPHLHFEVIQSGENINPKNVLP